MARPQYLYAMRPADNGSRMAVLAMPIGSTLPVGFQRIYMPEVRRLAIKRKDLADVELIGCFHYSRNPVEHERRRVRAKARLIELGFDLFEPVRLR